MKGTECNGRPVFKKRDAERYITAGQSKWKCIGSLACDADFYVTGPRVRNNQPLGRWGKDANNTGSRAICRELEVLHKILKYICLVLNVDLNQKSKENSTQTLKYFIKRVFCCFSVLTLLNDSPVIENEYTHIDSLL